MSVKDLLTHERAVLEPSLRDPQFHRFKVITPAQMPDLVPANISMALGAYSTDGYDPFTLQWYWRMRDLIEDRLRTGDVTLLEMLNVKYIVSQDELDVPGAVLLTDTSPKVYRLAHPLPSAFLVGDYKLVPGEEAVLKAMSDTDFAPEREALLDESDFLHSHPISDSESPGEAHVTDITSNRLLVQMQAQSPALLVMSEMYFPGWNAYLDGKKLPVHRVNYALRGVFVPSGSHRVMLVFESDAWRIGGALSGVALLVWGTLLTACLLGSSQTKDGLAR